MKYLKSLTKAVLLYIFPAYSKKVSYNYWSKTDQVHSKPSQSMYKRMFSNLEQLIQPTKKDKILDYGCGDGGIAILFKKKGYNITCCDISPVLIERAKKKGLSCFTCDHIMNSGKKFNIIFINNTFFYIHPFERKQFLQKIYKRLAKNGRLYLTDEPDIEKRKSLVASLKPEKMKYFFFYNLATSLCPVFQVEQVGFFVDPRKVKKIGNEVGFKNFFTTDSWAGYRSHITLYK